MPKWAMRSGACHSVQTWTLTQSSTCTRSYHHELSNKPAHASNDSLRTNLQPCKVKVAIFMPCQFVPFLPVFGTNIRLTPQPQAPTQKQCLRLLQHPLSLHFHASQDKMPAAYGSWPPKATRTQFPGRCYRISCQFCERVRRPTQQAHPGLPLPQPEAQMCFTPSTTIPVSRPAHACLVHLVKLHSACMRLLMTQQPHTLNMCLGTLGPAGPSGSLKVTTV